MLSQPPFCLANPTLHGESTFALQLTFLQYHTTFICIPLFYAYRSAHHLAIASTLHLVFPPFCLVNPHCCLRLAFCLAPVNFAHLPFCKSHPTYGTVLIWPPYSSPWKYDFMLAANLPFCLVDLLLLSNWSLSIFYCQFFLPLDLHSISIICHPKCFRTVRATFCYQYRYLLLNLGKACWVWDITFFFAFKHKTLECPK